MKAYAVIITHVLNYCSQCILRLMYYVIYDLHTQDSDNFFFVRQEVFMGQAAFAARWRVTEYLVYS